VRRLRPLLGAVVASLVVAGCAPAPQGSIPATVTAHAVVPGMPLPPGRSMVVSAALLEQAACDECERVAGADRDRFFSGRLALAALDALLAAPAGPDRTGHAGNLLVSGYFGGIQLRGVLGSIGARDAGPAAPLLEQVGRSTAVGLEQEVGRLQRLAADGSDAQVGRTMADLAPVLALLYGYNLGYLRETLEHPPAGTTVEGRIECPTELSCRTPALPLSGAGRYDATFARLADPGGDPRWSSTAAVLHGLVDAAEPGGRAVWSQLLAGDGFDAGGYEAIVDLSGGFLQVSGVALAGAAEAASGGDPMLARAALALTAGLIAWAGSYFLGLASPLPDTALPQLACG
jgi:hypothetical protein